MGRADRILPRRSGEGRFTAERTAGSLVAVDRVPRVIRNPTTLAARRGLAHAKAAPSRHGDD